MFLSDFGFHDLLDIFCLHYAMEAPFLMEHLILINHSAVAPDERGVQINNFLISVLILKAPRKSASGNVISLCRLLHLLANFSNLHFAYRQTVWTQIRLLLKEQSDLGPHCLQQ